MFTPRTFRWLPTLALLAALPSATQAQASVPPAQTADQNAVPAATPPPVPAQPAVPPAATQSNRTAVIPASNPTPEELGDSLQGHQRYQAAIAAYQTVPHPSAAVWNKMGIAYQMMFNLKDATRCYKESLKLNPRSAQVYNNLGTVYDSGKDWKNGEKMYRKALKLDPKSALILKNLGTNLLSQHRYDKGWQVYQQALAIDPNIFQDHTSPKTQNPSSVGDRGATNYFMARGCVRTGQTECAIEYLRLAHNEAYTNPKKIAQDEDFSSLRDNPAFQQLLAEQQQQKPQQNP